MKTFSFNPPINLAEEEKWLLAVISFEPTNSIFNLTDENKSSAISAPSHGSSREGAETINRLQQILKLRSENDIKLHVEQVRKRGKQLKIGDKEYKLSDLDTRKNEIIK